MTYYRVDEESEREIVLEEIALEGDYEPLEKYISFPKIGSTQTRKDDCTFPTFDHDDEKYELGLTKREYFAAVAMQGLLSSQKAFESPESIAMDAIHAADALILILNKSESELPNKY